MALNYPLLLLVSGEVVRLRGEFPLSFFLTFYTKYLFSPLCRYLHSLYNRFLLPGDQNQLPPTTRLATT